MRGRKALAIAGTGGRSKVRGGEIPSQKRTFIRLLTEEIDAESKAPQQSAAEGHNLLSAEVGRGTIDGSSTYCFTFGEEM